jgi:hypothetical protein
MSNAESKMRIHPSENSKSFRLLSRQLARELTETEIDAVPGGGYGTNSCTRIRANDSIKTIVTDDADA